MIKVLSLEAETNKSGLDGVVAREVTQPLWPIIIKKKKKKGKKKRNVSIKIINLFYFINGNIRYLKYMT